PLLPSALRARQRDLAAALPDPAAAERALVELERHLLAEVYAQQRQAARMAVRIARWLGTPEPEVRSVAAGLRQQVTEWGWADWAREVVWAGDDSADPQVADAYRRLCERAIQRRDRLDQRFAERLAPWAERAATQAPQDCLLIEDVLDRVAVPLARSKVPLVVVLPGMNAAVAAELGQELAQWQHWVEAGPEPGARLAAAAAVPSTGGTGLAALLSGTLGNEDTAQAGFAAFWKRHRKQAKLFTSAEIGGGAGHRLDGEVLTALAEDKVVGLVLDTIDDTLGRGRPGSGAGWRIGDIRFLGELLAQASSYGRPVLLATDHGHVLDRGTPGVEIDGEHGARWRTGAAGEGELELTGPRVGDGGGRVTVPWRTGIHYGRARAGYHGGANPAELAAPVLVLLPSRELLPSGWSALSPESVPPAWWRGTSSGRPEAAPEPRKPARDRGKATAQQGAALFEVHEPAAPAPSSLGERVVASKVYEAQKVFVRKAPAAKVVAAVLDRIVEAGGTLSVTAVVAAAGTAARNPDGFLATLQRLLNVEGYPVIEPIDAGRNVKVQVELLREQFEVDGT
ncbi:BREX-2 system phosphatase PglZ, partial [Amycolatopsis cihanbeyliensis]